MRALRGCGDRVCPTLCHRYSHGVDFASWELVNFKECNPLMHDTRVHAICVVIYVKNDPSETIVDNMPSPDAIINRLIFPRHCSPGDSCSGTIIPLDNMCVCQSYWNRRYEHHDGARQ